MTLFHEYLEGIFDNRIQAMKYPTRYARIIITHERIDENWFYGKQAYHHSQNSPYREFRMLICQEGEKFRVKNFDKKGLTYKEGCDTIFEMIGDEFHGHNTDCTCWVNWKSVTTYLTNSIVLGYNTYKVMDSGIDPKTGQKIWGSQWGHLEFIRYCSSAG
jgi:hypothetical protein